MELIKQAFADRGYRYGLVAGFSLGATVFCGTFAVLLLTGVVTA